VGPERPAEAWAEWAIAEDWAADGQSILYTRTTGGNAFDIWALPLHDGARSPKHLVSAELFQGLAKFSSDSRWIAYESTESGRREIYVQPSGSGRWQITTAGGRYVRWARNGRELFYLKDDGSLMVVDVAVQGSTFKAGTPRLLFKINVLSGTRSAPARRRRCHTESRELTSTRRCWPW
jgi:Tol biopolymer transport system component